MFALKCVVLLITAGSALAAEMPWRAWQFHKLDLPYVTASMKRARAYDVKDTQSRWRRNRFGISSWPSRS